MFYTKGKKTNNKKKITIEKKLKQGGPANCSIGQILLAQELGLIVISFKYFQVLTFMLIFD